MAHTADSTDLPKKGPDPFFEEKSNILIVDDLQEKLLVFKTVLEDLDQNLVMVRSGSEALREVLAQLPAEMPPM